MSSRITYESLPPEIKKVADSSLGLGVLRSLFTYRHEYHLVMKISDGIFIGFALYHYNEQVLAGGRKYVTGVIDCVCVAPAYRRERFGTGLVYSVLSKMAAYGVDRVEAFLKLPQSKEHDGEPGVPFSGSEEMLVGMGFRRVEAFDRYFEKMSKKEGYSCLFCGDFPDSCRAVLYAIDSL